MATQVCAPCNDSPLSMTGNIIGVLTFAYVLGVGISYRISLVQNSLRDLETLDIEGRFVIRRAEAALQKLKNPPEDAHELDLSFNEHFISDADDALNRDKLALKALHDKVAKSGKERYFSRPMLGWSEVVGEWGWKGVFWKFLMGARFLVVGFRYMIRRDEMKELTDRLRVWSEQLKELADEADSARTAVRPPVRPATAPVRPATAPVQPATAPVRPATV